MMFHLKMRGKVMLRVWVNRIEHLSCLTAYLPWLVDCAEAPKDLERASRPLSSQEL